MKSTILAIPFVLSAFATIPAYAGEVMKDRCSADVAFPATYDGNPNSKGTIILSRGGDGSTTWSVPFTVKLSNEGRIRWWCNSTTGNAFDPGTWRVESIDFISTDFCLKGIAQTVATGAIDPGAIKYKDAAKVKIAQDNGWTAERSRCNNKSNKIRARLGPNRLLKIECLGKAEFDPAKAD